MSRPNKWKDMVKQSKEEIEDFNDFAEDKTIVWADKEMSNYRRAMLLLFKSNNNWDMYIEDEEQCKFIETMVRRAVLL